jgi:hypothetical protein
MPLENIFKASELADIAFLIIMTVGGFHKLAWMGIERR